MNETYEYIRSGGAGFYEMPRGLIAAWGKEAVQFLNGMITNDAAKLEDGLQMIAAFPNAQGRLLAVVRVLRCGDRFLFETEEATHETLHSNLFRFTFAGDFFVEDLSPDHTYFEVFGPREDVYNANVGEKFPGGLALESPAGAAYFVPISSAEKFRNFLIVENECRKIPADVYEILRIEAGIPKCGVDMDETTIVPELGLEDLISYNKGCYVGQEIIARIHFRGHVAKQLTGVVLSEPPAVAGGSSHEEAELTLMSQDGKNAGRITSFTFSPKLEKTIALAYVRYDYLAAGTELKLGDAVATVTPLPFVR